MNPYTCNEEVEEVRLRKEIDNEIRRNIFIYKYLN
jgi:hypothetical protein